MFLDRNDRIVGDVSDALLFEFVVNVAADTFPRPAHGLHHDSVVEEIAAWLRTNTHSKIVNPSPMRTLEFLERVNGAGGRWRESGTSYVVWGPESDSSPRSIRIGRDTRTLDGNVVRSYLRKLGLSEGQSGIAFQEFLEGLPPEQEALRRFRNVLRDLANA